MLKFKKIFSSSEDHRLDPDSSPVMYDCGPIWKDNESIKSKDKIPNEYTEEKGKMKILFIDDDPIARDMMKRFSDREENVDVTTAEDGSEGLKLAKEVVPDVIIVDLNMPVLDGFQVLHELKGANKQKKAPVIILTSDDTDESMIKSFNLGADAFFHKPIEPKRLLGNVKRVFRYFDY